jgi:hypothetical protein
VRGPAKLRSTPEQSLGAHRFLCGNALFFFFSPQQLFRSSFFTSRPPFAACLLRRGIVSHLATLLSCVRYDELLRCGERSAHYLSSVCTKEPDLHPLTELFSEMITYFSNLRQNLDVVQSTNQPPQNELIFVFKETSDRPAWFYFHFSIGENDRGGNNSVS